MRTSNEIAELAKGLSRAQGQFTAAERAHVAKVNSKKGEGSSYSYNYADLQAYLDVVREPLAAAGLSFVQLPTVKGDEAAVVTILMHESGQFIESDPLTLSVDHDPDKRPTPQAIGSAITYARRYSLSAITGMASEADDDGAGASGLNAETGQRKPNPVCPNCSTNLHVIKGKEEYGGGWLCWKSKGGCGAKWHDEPLPEADPFGEPEPKANGKLPPEVQKLAKDNKMKTGDEVGLSASVKSAFEKLTQAVRNHSVEEVAAIINRATDMKDKGQLSDKALEQIQREANDSIRKINAVQHQEAAA